MSGLVSFDSLIARLGLALAIGLLVGLERGWRERAEPAGSRTAGIRTYGAVGLLGGVTAALSQALAAPAVLVAGLLGFSAVFAWFKQREEAQDGGFSVTGVVAAMLVFSLGALAALGEVQAAAAGAALLAGLLASRETLHGLLQRLSWTEVRSALTLAVMTAVVLPLLPNRAIDPWGGFNPWEVWLFTVLMATISFMGYAAVRLLGPARGMVVSGIAGALISSTAVTVALARQAAGGERAAPLAGAACLAAMTSLLRVAAVTLILRPQILTSMAPETLAAALTFAVCGGLLLTRGKASGAAATPGNPFELGSLLLFALMFALISTISAAVVGRFGGGSLVATSALSGMFDVDVAVLSALRLTDQGVAAGVIGHGVLAALCANAVGRLALAIAAGPASFWLPLLGATIAAATAGGFVLFTTG